MIFTTNKSLQAWGKVLHHQDLADAIVERILERGRLVRLDGPSMRTRHLTLDSLDGEPLPEPARISGMDRPQFPEPTAAALVVVWPPHRECRFALRQRKPGTDDRRPLHLAPVYDMLPMHYRPTATGEILTTDFPPPLPAPQALQTWQRAAMLALAFWQCVQGDERISEQFRIEARRVHDALSSIVDRVG